MRADGQNLLKHCHDTCRCVTEAKLRRVIESEGAETFNQAIREVGRVLFDSAERAGTLRKSRYAKVAARSAPGDTENPLAGAAAGEEEVDELLRADFAALDTNSDGRLCRLDLLRAYGGSAAVDGSGGFMGAAQVDDLLRCIATGDELRVNGSLSIGVGDFSAWMRRSRP